jgi:hypothetical protein
MEFADPAVYLDAAIVHTFYAVNKVQPDDAHHDGFFMQLFMLLFNYRFMTFCTTWVLTNNPGIFNRIITKKAANRVILYVVQ